MRTAEHAQKAAESLHKKHIGERYIEVFQCSHSEMNFMLMHGIPTHRHQHTAWINTAPYSPHTPPHVATAFTYPPVSTSALTYPPVSPPTTTVHSNSPHCSPMMSMPSSPTLSPPARMFVASHTHGYVPYASPPYNVFNFNYPSSNVPVEPAGIPQSYESRVFFPNYQVSKILFTLAVLETLLWTQSLRKYNLNVNILLYVGSEW